MGAEILALSIPLYMIWWKVDDILIEIRSMNASRTITRPT